MNDSLSILLISHSFLIRLGDSFFKNVLHRKLKESVQFTCISNVYAGFRIIKSKDFQKVVLSTCQNDNTPREIHRDLNGGSGFKNNQMMVPNDPSVSLYRIINYTRLPTFR